MRFLTTSLATMSTACVLALPTILLGQQTEDVSRGEATAQTAQASSPPAFPDLRIPDDASIEKLQAIVQTAKGIRPADPDQYQAMQAAIRDASRRLLRKLKGKEASPEYRQAETDAISASIVLMTFVGEDAKQRTVEQVHRYLKERKELTLADVQMGIMAAAMLELQPNKQPARDTYELMDNLLKEDPRTEMQALRLNLQSNVRRLDLLGNKFELSAKTVDGKTVSTDDFAGKFVIVDFFATWCEPCLDEIPRLKEYYEKHHERGLEVLAISVDAERDALDAYLAKAKLPWPVIHDAAENPLDSLQMQFGISQLPTLMLLNKEGTVVSLEARGAELDRLIQMLFETPTPAPANDPPPNESSPPEANPPTDDQ